MKKRVASLFISLLNMFSLKGNGDAQIIKWNTQSKNKKYIPILFANSYVKAYTYKNILEFEFYIDSDDVVISVLNPLDNIIYKEVTHTVDTLHLMIETKSWLPGIYTININNINDISVSGNFLLTK